jgi:hypothetical protein
MDAEHQDMILEIMMRECENKNRFPSTNQINIIYDGTTKNSPARKLLVDFLRVVGSETLKEETTATRLRRTSSMIYYER